MQTKEGKTGRTYHHKGLINGKVPVYVATQITTDKNGIDVPTQYDTKAILCQPSSLKTIGFIN